MSPESKKEESWRGIIVLRKDVREALEFDAMRAKRTAPRQLEMILMHRYGMVSDTEVLDAQEARKVVREGKEQTVTPTPRKKAARKLNR